MCGRTTLFTPAKIGKRFNVSKLENNAFKKDFRSTYNAAPSQILPTIVRNGSSNHIRLMKWGFLPPWAKDPGDTFKYKTFNARAEDIFTKPTWRSAIRHARCLVPANGFYEWQATKSTKQPYFIYPKDQGLFAFAGIYNIWKNEHGEEWDTYSIITTTPNQEMAKIHNRMPVILHPKDEKLWLDPNNESEESIASLLQPYGDGMLEIYKVSRDVNTARVDNESLIHSIE